MELFVHVKELGELFTNNQRTIEQNQLETNHLMNVLEDRLAANVSLITSYSKKILDYQTICANHDEIRKELSAMKSHPRGRLTAKTKSAPAIKSCQEANSPTSGIFKMAGINGGDSFDVFCELESFDGGWLVFQQRYNGSVDFYRNWMAYRNGFGDVGGEFWLGLEKIYQLTKEGTWELIVELKDFHDNYKYARYSKFGLGNESEKYALSKLGTYSGTAGDSLGSHKGMKFSTYDNDNDTHNSKNCAENKHGAWWFLDCFYSHLNGQHSDSDDTTAIKWPNSESGLKFTRMMIRKV
uniref:Fibrinogen-like protein A n=2 Tax=Culex pipiens TaxID=7175 RepID=A0A8D8CE94_CULPI